jgi:hypothetical protein
MSNHIHPVGEAYLLLQHVKGSHTCAVCICPQTLLVAHHCRLHSSAHRHTLSWLLTNQLVQCQPAVVVLGCLLAWSSAC